GGLPAADGRARAVHRRGPRRATEAETGTAPGPTATGRADARAARRSTSIPLLSSPEIRIDQLTGLRTILAPGRAARPAEFGRAAGSRKGEGSAAKRESCPFCEGREDRTPPELYALRPEGSEPDTPGWQTRVVPNLYPALGGETGGDGSAAAG